MGSFNILVVFKQKLMDKIFLTIFFIFLCVLLNMFPRISFSEDVSSEKLEKPKWAVGIGLKEIYTHQKLKLKFNDESTSEEFSNLNLEVMGETNPLYGANIFYNYEGNFSCSLIFSYLTANYNWKGKLKYTPTSSPLSLKETSLSLNLRREELDFLWSVNIPPFRLPIIKKNYDIFFILGHKCLTFDLPIFVKNNESISSNNERLNIQFLVFGGGIKLAIGNTGIVGYFSSIFYQPQYLQEWSATTDWEKSEEIGIQYFYSLNKELEICVMLGYRYQHIKIDATVFFDHDIYNKDSGKYISEEMAGPIFAINLMF